MVKGHKRIIIKLGGKPEKFNWSNGAFESLLLLNTIFLAEPVERKFTTFLLNCSFAGKTFFPSDKLLAKLERL